MTVIDLREELNNRNIDIIDVTDKCIYYSEEFMVNDSATIYIYTYDLFDNSERVVCYFTFEEETFLPHYYICGDSIIMLLENDGSRAWILKIDKNSKSEVMRKNVPLIGKYFDCVPIDDNNIIIYSKSDDDYRDIFNRCLKNTGFDTLANMYDLDKSYRYFIRDFKTAGLVKDHMHTFTDSKGNERMILCDSCCESEFDKEKLSKNNNGIEENMQDNILEISKSRFLESVRSGKELIGAKRIASAGAEGFVRFECATDGGIFFRAKVFKSGLEKFFKMSTAGGCVKPMCNVREKNDSARYFTDTDCGKIYYMKRDGEIITVLGEINSCAELSYPYTIGQFTGCMDDRFIIADNSKSVNEPSVSIYDGRLGLLDTYQAKFKMKKNVLVIY